MRSTVLRYRDWIVTAHARGNGLDPEAEAGYTGVAFIEKFELRVNLCCEAASQNLRRRAYYAEGTFVHASEAKDSAVAVAKRAIDKLFS